MKIVKEYLNEIKQNREISGLGTIGIGKDAYLKAWRSAKIEIPTIIVNCKQMDEVFKDTVYDVLRKLIQRRGNFLFSDMLWLDVEKEGYNWAVRSQIRNWEDNWNFSKIILRVNVDLYSYRTDRYTNCVFDEDARIGKLDIKGHDEFGKINGFFIQNK